MGAAMMANRGTLKYAVGLGWDVNRFGASMDLDAWALAVDFNNKNNYFCILLTFPICFSPVSISSTGIPRVCCHCYISLLLNN